MKKNNVWFHESVVITEWDAKILSGKKGVIIPSKLVLVLYLGMQNLASNWIQIFKYFKVLFTTELQRKRKSKKNQSRLITYTSSGEMDDLWGYMH